MIASHRRARADGARGRGARRRSRAPRRGRCSSSTSAVPRNVEPAVNDLDDVFCYDVDDLRRWWRRTCASGSARPSARRPWWSARWPGSPRRLATSRWCRPSCRCGRSSRPSGAPRWTRRSRGCPAPARRRGRCWRRSSQAIVNKVLHAPIVKLRDSSRAGHGRRWTEVMSEIFGLRRSAGRARANEGPARHARQPARPRPGGGGGGGAPRARRRGGDRAHPDLGRSAGPGRPRRLRGQGALREGDRGGAARRPRRRGRAQPQGHARRAAAGLALAAYPPREDPPTCSSPRDGGGLADLPAGAVVGTSSLRRRVLLAARPDLRAEPIRGNVDTRLASSSDGDYDALVMAAAGLGGSGSARRARTPLDPDEFLPAVGQGILGVEARAGRRGLLELLRDAGPH